MGWGEGWEMGAACFVVLSSAGASEGAWIALKCVRFVAAALGVPLGASLRGRAWQPSRGRCPDCSAPHHFAVEASSRC